MRDSEYLTTIGVLVAMIVGILFLANACDNERERECHAKGGQYVRLYKSSLCVKPGSVIE